MSKNNYRKFYNNPETKETVVEEKVETPVEEVTPEVVEDVKEPVVEKPVEKKSSANKPVYGYVTDCSRLNIRKTPSVNSKPVCVVNADTKLVINESNSTTDWYSVTTPTGVEGYCMRKFVRVK